MDIHIHDKPVYIGVLIGACWRYSHSLFCWGPFCLSVCPLYL